MNWLLLLIIVEVIQFPLIYGMVLADFQGSFPDVRNARKDSAAALGFSLWGCLLPGLALVCIMFLSGFAEHGLKYRAEGPRTD